MFRHTAPFARARGMFVAGAAPPFGLAQLQADPNCVLVQDPSAFWGSPDHLPRRNRLTYSNSFTASPWTATPGVTLAPNSQIGPDGQMSATRVTWGGTNRSLTQNFTHSTDTVQSYIYVKGTAGETISFGMNSVFEQTILDGTWQRLVVERSVTSGSQSFVLIRGGADNANIVDVADAMCASNTVSDHSNQRVTDWTTELYAWAAQKNVPWLRRNRVSYSETFSVDWVNQISGTGTAPVVTPAYAQDPNGQNTAVRFQCGLGATPASAQSEKRTTSFNAPIGTTGCRFSAKSNDGNTYTFRIRNNAAAIDGINITITPIWQEFAFTASQQVTSGYAIGLLGSYSTSNTCDVLIAFFRCGPTGAAYQKIGATWPATYTDLAIAAGYPISLYTDSAGTTAVCQPDDPIGKVVDLSGKGNHATQASSSLKPTIELDGNGKWRFKRDLVDDNLPITFASNLTSTGVIYTASEHVTTKDSGLTISGATDFKEPQYDYGRIIMAAESPYDAKIIKYLDGKRGRGPYALGPELVTNGTFTDDTTGWSAANTTLASVSGELRVTATSTSNLYAGQQLVTVVGKTYLLQCSLRAPSVNTAVNVARARAYNASSLTTVLGSIYVTTEDSTVTSNLIFTATTTTTFIQLGVASSSVWGANGDIAYFDNVSVREVLL